MKSSICTQGIRFLLLGYAVVLYPFIAVGQDVSALTGTPSAEAVPAPAPADETGSVGDLKDAAAIDAAIKQADARADEIARQIAQQSAYEADASLVPGVPLEDIQARTGSLKGLQAAYQQLSSNLRALGEAREQQEKTEKSRDGFTKLDQEPPYTFAYLDQLYAQVSTKRMALEAEKQAQATSRQMYAREEELSDDAKTLVNQASDRAGSASEEEKARANYILDTARFDLRASEVRDRATEIGVSRANSRVKRAEADVALEEKRLALAKPQAIFRPQELEDRKNRQKEAEAAYDKEINRLRRERDKRQAQVTDLERRQAAADTAADAGIQGDLEIARIRLAIAQESLQALQVLRGLESTVTDIWRIRFEIANPGLAEKSRPFQELSGELQEQLKLHESMRDVNEQMARSTRAQVVGLENQAGGLAEGSPERALADRRLAAYRELEPVLDRSVVRVGDIIALIQYSMDELEAKALSMSLWRRLKMTTSWITNLAAGWADRELVDVGGESITARKLVHALLLLLFGFVGGHFLIRTIFRRFLSRFNIRTNAAVIIENLSKYFLLLLVFYATLRYLNISLTVFTFLGGAIAIGVGFGAQNLISNFLSGLIIMGEQPIRVGDIVEVDGTSGTIMTIGARASLLRTFSGVEVLIPNSKFLENKVVNWTLTDSLLRFDIKAGVAYGSKPRTVVELMEQAAKEHGQVLNDPAPVAVLEEFGDNTLNFSLYFWLNLATTDSRVVRSDLRRKIYKSFQAAGVEFAFPQRDMHLHTTAPIRVTVEPMPPVNTDAADDASADKLS